MSTFVLKRDGRAEPVYFHKIQDRIESCSQGLKEDIHVEISQGVIAGFSSGMSTFDLDELAASNAFAKSTTHPDYGILASRIAVSNLQKSTDKMKDFGELVKLLINNVDPKKLTPFPLIHQGYADFVLKNLDRIRGAIQYKRDYQYDYFGIKTLMFSYLVKVNGKIVERPQHMHMRVACFIHLDDIEAALETYEYLSKMWCTHASPTLFNAATPRPMLSSCFLLVMQGDSIEGIYDTVKQVAEISKCGGGVGVGIQNIRSAGAIIHGSNGTSNGIIPMLRNFDSTVKYVDQGGNKRKGAMAHFIEPWHPDFMKWLSLRKTTGNADERTRDLYQGKMIPDLFMKRVALNGVWTLLDPDECGSWLYDTWGEPWERRYIEHEAIPRLVRAQIPAREVYTAILRAQLELGGIYMLFKDSCNRKSNHQHLGTIRTSNLCTEILQYTSPDEIAVCNLASISLPACVDVVNGVGTFNFDRLYKITTVLTNNLNKVIDRTYYPLPETKKSNLRHRPMGLGTQGFQEALIKMGFPYESKEARVLNREIFETIYFAALTTSKNLAKRDGPYPSYEGSPMSKGILQMDMWNPEQVHYSGRWSWSDLRSEIKQYGVRNSLLVAPMPTASTSQMLKNTESNEPLAEVISKRGTLAGEFITIAYGFMEKMMARGQWSTEMKEMIIANRGSIQDIPGIPEDIKALYKTVWEIPQDVILEMAAERGPFIDQSQSLNLHIAEPDTEELAKLQFKAWKLGLKGLYYVRTKAATDAIQFSVPTEIKAKHAAIMATSSVSSSSTITTTSLVTTKKVPDNGSSVPQVPPPITIPTVDTKASSNQPHSYPLSSPMVSLMTHHGDSPTVTPSSSLSSSEQQRHERSSFDPDKAGYSRSSSLSSSTSIPQRSSSLVVTKEDIEAAVKRQEENAKKRDDLMCSLVNKDACRPCSG